MLLNHGVDPNLYFSDMHMEMIAWEGSNGDIVDLLCASGMIISGEVDNSWHIDVRNVI